MKQETCLIIGAGAIGLLWATKLATRNVTPHLLYRTTNPSNKITLEDSTNGLSSDFEITTYTLDSLNQKYDNILICTKSFDVLDAYRSVKKYTYKNADIWTLCNGMGVHDELCLELKSSQTLWSGVTSEGALKKSRNTVQKTGEGDTFFGKYHPQSSNSKGSLFKELISPNITQRMLEKLAVNCVINPITALFGIRNGELLEEPYKSLAERCTNELCDSYLSPSLQSLMRHPSRFSYSNLINRVYTVAQMTRLNHSSMHEDLRFGRRSEIENICGYVIENATKTPVLQEKMRRAILFSGERESLKKSLLETS